MNASKYIEASRKRACEIDIHFLEDYRRGLSLVEVARKHGVTKQRAHQRLKRAGYKRRSSMIAVIGVDKDCVVISKGASKTRIGTRAELASKLDELQRDGVSIYCSSAVDFPDEHTSEQWILEVCKELRDV